MYSYGPPHMAKQKQDDQLEHTYSSYVRIRDVALKTYQKRWMMGRSGKRGLGISMLEARHDDDDDSRKNFRLKIFWVFQHFSNLRKRQNNCENINWYKGREMGQVFVAASHQTRLNTRSKARRPIKVGIKGRGRSGTSRDSDPACLCCSSTHLVQCEPDEASSFTNRNVGPGTYASLRLKLDAWSSAVQGGQRRQKMQLAHPKVA